MATTRIMPLHVGKGRTESRAISDIIDYVANPQKTDHGRLITGYECDSRVADAEFMLAKRQYKPSSLVFTKSPADWRGFFVGRLRSLRQAAWKWPLPFSRH